MKVIIEPLTFEETITFSELQNYVTYLERRVKHESSFKWWAAAGWLATALFHWWTI